LHLHIHCILYFNSIKPHCELGLGANRPKGDPE
jgi:hypothetical protein